MVIYNVKLYIQTGSFLPQQSQLFDQGFIQGLLFT